MSRATDRVALFVVAAIVAVAAAVAVAAVGLTPGQHSLLRWILAGLTVVLWLGGLALRWRDRRSGPTVDG